MSSLGSAERFPLRINVNLRLGPRTEALVYRANRSLVRAGFRRIQFGQADRGPTPHVTISRSWAADVHDLEELRATFSIVVRDALSTGSGGACRLRIEAPKLKVTRGPYVLSPVVLLGGHANELVQRIGGLGQPLHLTLAAGNSLTGMPPNVARRTATLAYIRSVRLSVQGPYGTCIETLEEVRV